ncbi:SMI1/KNR4 family protein [Lysobacter sp. CA199]|uniref:SMI1/KNR4 family protein n=1 Tax=Lysobacter sp. CA199 TaxID=3455608 RepID=UPI003F8D7CA6
MQSRAEPIDMDFAQYLRKIEKIYAKHDVAWSAKVGAAESKIVAGENTLGFALDPGLRAAWGAMDGSDEDIWLFARPDYLSSYEFLSVTDALAQRESMRRRAGKYAGYEDPEPRDARIRPGWFHEGWLPFANFAGATLMLIQDYSPAPGGRAGQILSFSHDPDRIEYVAADFGDYLKRSLSTIEADPEEFLQLF